MEKYSWYLEKENKVIVVVLTAWTSSYMKTHKVKNHIEIYEVNKNKEDMLKLLRQRLSLNVNDNPYNIHLNYYLINLGYSRNKKNWIEFIESLSVKKNKDNIDYIVRNFKMKYSNPSNTNSFFYNKLSQFPQHLFKEEHSLNSVL